MLRNTIRVDVKGIKDIARNLGIVENTLLKAAGKALYAEAREVLKEANIECPKDTLALSKSRFVTPPIRTQQEIKVIAGFGTDSVINPKTNQPTSLYAIYVHERLDLHHPQGKAKFLEDPVNRRRGSLEQNVAARIAPLIGR